MKKQIYYIVNILFGIATTLFVGNLLFASAYSQSNKFAIIGDFGFDGSDELAVANLVKNWNPEFIITVGDNNYDNGAASTIDANIGKYFHDFIYPYIGTYGAGSPDFNRFFPVPGNHDWRAANLQPYLDYFTLPNNERYYDFVWNNIHFFMIDADPLEPDGWSQTSTQALWMKAKMLDCEVNHSHWEIAVLHQAPYSSANTHGSSSTTQWPFKDWGIDVVVAGHDHTYERLIFNELVYFVNGLGGKSLRTDDFDFGILPESQSHYAAKYGAMLVTTDVNNMTLSFYNIDGTLIDSYVVHDNPLPVELISFTGKFVNNAVILEWTTATEINNYGFNIEKKISGFWQNIDFVSGNGNSNSPKFYSFVDEDIDYLNIYRLKQIDNDGKFEYSKIIAVTSNQIKNYELAQNYPNPFNPTTRINYSIKEKSNVELKIFDLLGSEISLLVSEEKAPGNYEVFFDAGHLSSGVYFYTIKAGNFFQTRKMLFMK